MGTSTNCLHEQNTHDSDLGRAGKEGHGGRGTPAPGVFGQSCEGLPLAGPQSGHAVGSEHLLATKYSPAPDSLAGMDGLPSKAGRVLLTAKWLLIPPQMEGTLTQASLLSPLSQSLSRDSPTCFLIPTSQHLGRQWIITTLLMPTLRIWEDNARKRRAPSCPSACFSDSCAAHCSALPDPVRPLQLSRP